jgi:hypothetical protein
VPDLLAISRGTGRLPQATRPSRRKPGETIQERNHDHTIRTIHVLAGQAKETTLNLLARR